MSDFKLPDVGEGISEAELLEWHVSVGDVVEEHQVVASISTDKVNVELPSPRAGAVVEICWSEGDIIPVGAVLLRFGATDPDAAPAPAVESAAASATPATPVLDDGDGAALAGEGEGRSHRAPGPPPAAPSTRRYAAERGIDLTLVVASGPGGRVLRADIDAALAVGAAREVELEPLTSGRFIPLRGVRGVMARRMLESAQRTATSTSTFEVEADGIIQVLEDLRDSEVLEGSRLSPLAVIAKCTAAALVRHPRFNSTIAEGGSGIHVHESVDLSIAVASEEGLTVPVVRGAERCSLTELAARIRDLAERARAGRLEAAELRGGTFTVSSTGGIERLRMVSTTPIINLPQTAILWVSRIEDRPRVRHGVLEAGPMMTASVSFDHRFIDGAEVTAFMNTLSNLFERPLQALA